MANKGDIYKVALPNGDEYNFKDKYVRENYRALNNNDFDTINVTELNSGNIVNTGVARFLNPINGDITGHAALDLALTGGTVTGTLVLSKSQDASGIANNSPALIVGGLATQTHLEFDNNEIIAKADGVTTAPLYINNDGGNVYLSGSTVYASGTTMYATTFSGKATSAGTSDTTSQLKGFAEANVTTAASTGCIRYQYNVNRDTTGLFAYNDNSNSILTLNRHSGNYNSQLGFSSNGRLYYRAFDGGALDTTTAWKDVMFTTDTYSGTLTSSQVTTALGYTPANKAGDTFTGRVAYKNVSMPLSAGKVTSLVAGTTEIFKDGIAISNPATSNDVGWIRVTGTGESDTVMEIATGDDGGAGEQIVFRQYNTSNTVAREAKIFDTSGATSFPVSVTAPRFIGTADNADKVDGYHIYYDRYVSSTQLAQPTADTIWYVKVSTANWNSNIEVIQIRTGGNNRTGSHVLYTGSRGTKWWGYGQVYSHRGLSGVYKVISNSDDVYLRFDADCTATTIYTSFTPQTLEIVDSPSGANFTEVPTYGGWYGNQITVDHIQTNNYITIQKPTVASNTFDDTNPKIVFKNSGGSQNGSLTWTDYDSVQSPASLTLNGNQGGEYFIAPNIKATGSFYGNLSGNASTATSATTASYANSINLVATNEIRLGNRLTSNYDVWINYLWADGTASGTVTGYRFANGNKTLTKVYASEFNGALVGNVTGNVSGSSGSCTGNSATATNATNDKNGLQIDTNYLKKSGGTMTGQIMTSFKYAVAIGSRQSDATTITDLIADVRYSSGCCGSVNIGTAYKLNDVTIPTGWYNYTWIPHRSGGKNGSADKDNCNYGVLYLSHMTTPSNGTYEVSFSGSTIAQVRMIASFTTAPTTGQVLISNGVYGGIKSSGYTIATSVPSGAVFTDTTYSAGTGLTLSGTQFSVSSANASTIMNLLTTGSSAPTDNDYYISQYAGGGTSTTTYHRRPHSALWSYIKGKTDATYLPLAGGTMTGQIVLASTGYKTNSSYGYSVDQYGNFKHQSTNTDQYWTIANNAGTAKLSVYWETGKVVAANDVQSATVLCANTANSSTAGGLSLYGTNATDYGIAFRGTGNGGKHGYVQGDWAQYHYMAGADTRGWVFNAGASTGVASISRAGHMVLNGSLTVGGNATNTSGARMVYNATLNCIDFTFVA